MIPDIRDVPVPTVGRFYLVPCVALEGRRCPWPVMGTYHADPDLGVRFAHYHTDVRFISDRTLHRYEATRLRLARKWTLEQAAMTRVNITEEGPVLCRRRCHRQMAEFPQGKLQRILEPQFADFVLDLERPICPHQGGDLRAAPVDAQGVATCPLHGLRWDLGTGRLVPRTPAP